MPRFAYLTIALLPGVLSQTTTTVICTENSVSWTFNSLGVSPCQVAADLAGVCNGGVFNIGPLDSGHVYGIIHNSCHCNTIYYSLVSACAACQDRDWYDWTEYVAGCNATSPGVFPLPIPAGTRVPGWAYADVRVTGSFNLTVAESLDLLPEITGTASSTSSSTLPTSSTSSDFSTTSLTTSFTSLTSSTPSSTGTTSPGQSGGSSGANVGAIAGGVIGGVFGLALIGGIVFCFLRRRRQRSEQQPPSSAFNTAPYIAAPHSPDQKMSYDPPMNPVTPAQQSPYAQAYSASQASATQVGQYSPQMRMSGPGPAGRYSGVPEL